jgi:CHAT domain-containing protein/tetratricopeptide (TPR) repeat protein
MFIRRWPAIILLAVAAAGCGGMTHSEYLTNMNPVSLTAVKSKGDILIQEGLGYAREGDFDRSLSSLEGALAFFAADREKVSTIHGHIGKGYLDRNEYDRALHHYGQSLLAARQGGYGGGIVLATIGLANCYKKIGDPDKAVEVLAAVREKGDGGGEHPLIALAMGESLAQKGDLTRALDIFTRVLPAIGRTDDDRLKQSLYSSLGTTLYGLGRHEEAIAHYERALAGARKGLNTADTVDLLNHIGFCQIARKRYDRAAAALQEGLGLLTVMELNHPEKQMYANYGLGLLNEEQNRTVPALLYYSRAIELTEDLRGRLSSTEFRSFFLANKLAAYEHAIDILLTLDDGAAQDSRLKALFAKTGLSPVELAFYYAESTKARSYLELLSRTRTGTLADRIPPALAEQEKGLLRTIASLQETTGGQVKSPQEVLKKAKRDLDGLIARLRRDYPDYASIRYPEPVMAGNIPLRDHEVILAFKVNPAKTYLWVIEKGRKPAAIRIDLGREELARRIGEFRAILENPAGLGAYDPAQGEALGRLLLGEALEGIDPAKNVIITPDGVLSLLPFEALTAGKTARYLGEKYKISYYPSASVMTTIRHFRAAPRLPAPFFALGDPVYDDADPRYRLSRSGNSAAAATGGSPALSLRSAVINSGFSLPRLPETRDEVLKIGELFGYGEDNPNIKLDMDATKDQLLKADLGRYRFIHFATHGILSGDIPYVLEPALVLTQPGNRHPEDGFLRMSEVLEMRLNAEAVVLSACKTALGKEIAGEGVVGLSRAFMLAGSRSVIVSLWSVESNSTAILMKDFYTRLKPGRSKEEALRLAKQALKNQSLRTDDVSRGVQVAGRDRQGTTGTSHPFFWAPFILIGEWE